MIDGGNSSIEVPVSFRTLMFVEISGKLFNDEQSVRRSSSRYFMLMLMGRAFSFERLSRYNFLR